MYKSASTTSPTIPDLQVLIFIDAETSARTVRMAPIVLKLGTPELVLAGKHIRLATAHYDEREVSTAQRLLIDITRRDDCLFDDAYWHPLPNRNSIFTISGHILTDHPLQHITSLHLRLRVPTAREIQQPATYDYKRELQHQLGSDLTQIKKAFPVLQKLKMEVFVPPLPLSKVKVHTDPLQVDEGEHEDAETVDKVTVALCRSGTRFGETQRSKGAR